MSTTEYCGSTDICVLCDKVIKVIISIFRRMALQQALGNHVLGIFVVSKEVGIEQSSKSPASWGIVI